MTDAVLFVSASILAWALVLGIRRWAVPLRLLDQPTQRSMHSQVTPRGGGIAIVAVTLIGLAVVANFGTLADWPAFGGYLAGAMLIVAVSLVDDFRPLPAGLRLAAQVIAAAFVAAGFISQSGLLVPAGHSVTISIVIGAGLLWIVGLTNAYNFMDGIDGLAATQGVVAGLGWAILGRATDQSSLAYLGLFVAAGCTGFLVYNWPPAKIFMGDVGSAFLGFTFAFITLASVRQLPRVAVVGLLLIWPFIFDTTLTLVRRLMRGENLLIAHRSHLYQRLVLAGWRQASVTLLYAVLALVAFALGALWLVTGSAVAAYSVIAALVILSLGLLAVVIRAEHRVSRPADPRPLIGR